MNASDTRGTERTGRSRHALRPIAEALLPASVLIAILAIRARRHKHRLNEAWGLTALSKELAQRFELTVQGGPFAGLRLPAAAVHEHLGPAMMGTCEFELHDAILRLTPADVPLVVNIGSSFGYYAAGLARRFACPAVAFDPDPWARRAVREIARLNGLTIATKALCSREWLSAMAPGALLVMDCEGYEAELLAAPLPSSLRRSVMIIELHEHLRPGSDQDIEATLAPTHVIQRVPSSTHPPLPPVDLSFLDDKQRTLACTEIRAPQNWLVCTPMR